MVWQNFCVLKTGVRVMCTIDGGFSTGTSVENQNGKKECCPSLTERTVYHKFMRVQYSRRISVLGIISFRERRGLGYTLVLKEIFSEYS